MTRPALLLLALACGCAAFQGKTVDAAKDAVQQLPDILAMLKALLAALVALAAKVEQFLASGQRTTDAFGDAADWLRRQAGAFGALLVYIAWHRITEKWRHAKHSRKP